MHIWNIAPLPKEDDIQALSKAINTSRLGTILLLQREITHFESAKNFFRPSLNDLYDPYLMKDMDCAVSRVCSAITNGEKILIYGDYDVDGTTSVALFYKYLSNYHASLTYYIPDRYEEGYGVSIQGVDWAASQNIKLIISIDCGIKGHKAIDRARSLGLDFIVCDHHTPSNTLPNATAILDPKQINCAYPFKELSGCGVGFKLLQAVCSRMEWDSELLFDNLDLLAVSIASDIVPIIDENRIFSYFGLKKINANPNIGLKALIYIGKLSLPLNISSIVFGIAPRINAAGRIGHANEAVSLLISTKDDEAKRIASLINVKNDIRKEVQNKITDQAFKIADESLQLKKQKSILLFDPNWHKGIVGIVASKCVDRYYKPTIILTESNGFITGSARSVSGFNIYSAILKSSQWLEQFGGHKYAAGLSLKKDNLSSFTVDFERAVKSLITKDQEKRHLKIDVEITFNLILDKFLNLIKQMAPFGPYNPEPVFLAKNIIIKKASLLKKLHLKLIVEQNGVIFDAIGFNMSHHYKSNLQKKKILLAFTIDEHYFRKNRSIQLKIKDIRFI